MLRGIRKKSSSWIARTLVFVLAASFGLWGVQYFFTDHHGQAAYGQQIIMQIDQIDVRAYEYQSAARGLANSLAAQSVDQQLDVEAMMATPAFRRQVVERLTLRGLENAIVERNDFRAAPSSVNSYIVGQPAFSSDGVFNGELLQTFLRRNNLSLDDYQSSLQQDLALESFNVAFNASDFVVDKQLQFLTEQSYSERDFAVLPISVEALAASVELDGAALDAYWEQNAARYQSPQLYSFEYLLLDIADLLDQQEVTEAQLEEEYEFYLSEQRASSSVELAHILLVDSNASSVAAQLRERLGAGEDFAELARLYSADFATSNNGGSFGRIALSSLPAELSRAALALQPGVVSEPVRSEAGLHLLLLESELPPVATLEEVAEQLTTRLQASQAASVLLRASDELADLSFNSDELRSVAEAMDLELQSATGVGLDSELVLALGPVFASELQNSSEGDLGVNSTLLELERDQRYLVYQLTEYLPPQQLDLEQALPALEADWTREQAHAAAEALAAEVIALISERGEFDSGTLELDQLDNSEALGAWSLFTDVSLDSFRRDLESGASPDLSLQALGLDLTPAPGEQLALASLNTATGDVAVVVLTRLEVAQSSKLALEQKAELMAQLNNINTRATTIARRSNWRASSDTVINDDWFEENAPLQ